MDADPLACVFRYRDTVEGLEASQLVGFFVDWTSKPSPQVHLKILHGSSHVVVAIDEESEQVVGFVTAISDGVLSAYIPLLEVLPAYQERGIGSEPSAVELTGDPADVLAAWSASTLVVPAGHPNAGEPMTLPDYGVEFLRAAASGSSRPRASARHWPARPPTSRADTAPTSRDRPPRRRAPARRWAARLAAWAPKPGVGVCRDRNTALPPACDGLPGTPWLLAPRHPLDKLDLFRLS